ncbi:MAG: S8 family serine peptidase, partial [Armatimonadota bacterium]|nr:S8 family serine peptidase [Armatimonadota bacterium]
MYNALWQAAAGQVSSERMQADVNAFFEHSRWSSFHRIWALAQLIAERMTAAGLSDVRLIPFPADGRTTFGGWVLPKAYDVERATLSVVEGPRLGLLADYHTNPTCLMMYSRPTPPEGVTAEVAVADQPEACVPERVRGRLILTSGIGVALVDSGVSPTKDVVVKQSASFNKNASSVVDFYGHGTHLSGILAGNGSLSNGKFRGVVPGVTLYSLKVSDDAGMAFESDVVAALQWVYNNKAAFNI